MDKSLFLPSITFDEVIEADHNHITKLAVQLINANLSSEDVSCTINELSWRLVRHDVSEELVMRPAFEQYLGLEGVAMAKHDRDEHKLLKEQLLALHDQLHLHAEATTAHVEQRKALTLLRPLLLEMKEHMATESGQQLPLFSLKLSHKERLKLGKDYAMTLVLTPRNMASYRGRDNLQADMEAVPHVAEYMMTDITFFQNVLSQMTQEGNTQFLTQAIWQELQILGFNHSRLEYISQIRNPKTRL